MSFSASEGNLIYSFNYLFIIYFCYSFGRDNVKHIYCIQKTKQKNPLKIKPTSFQPEYNKHLINAVELQLEVTHSLLCLITAYLRTFQPCF